MVKNTSEIKHTPAEAGLFEGGPLAVVRAVRTRVKEDIDFLRGRIATLEQQTRPNKPVIQTYRTMLESRRSVLKWLDHGDDDATTERTGTG